MDDYCVEVAPDVVNEWIGDIEDAGDVPPTCVGPRRNTEAQANPISTLTNQGPEIFQFLKYLRATRTNTKWASGALVGISVAHNWKAISSSNLWWDKCDRARCSN